MSLRTRLLAATALVALIALVGADVATYASLSTFLRDRVRASLESAHVAIEASLDGDAAAAETGGEADRAPDRQPSAGTTGSGPTTTTSPPSAQAPIASPTFCMAVASLAPGTFVEVRTAAGKVVGNDDCPAVESGGNRFSPQLPTSFSAFLSSGSHSEPTLYFETPSVQASGPEFEVRVSRLESGSHEGDLLVLAQSLRGVDRTLGRLVLIELAVTGGSLVVAALLGWLLVGLGLRPLRRVERTAEAIARGDLAERVPDATSRTEVGQLGLAMNTMAESIEQAFAARDATESELRSSEERLRRFVADASHELRTPVAAVSAYAELFERADRFPEDLPRILHGIRNESRRMGHLVEDLLLLARLDEHRPVAREPVELVDLAAGALETARTVGPDWPVRLEASGAVEVLGDHAQLRQVLDNLLGNVRAHTPKGTMATVRVSEEGDTAILAVADEGPGLPPEARERVFERFYRADPSRSRASGGSGLGLSIVASIVEAHGGSVSVTSTDTGTTFTVRIPSTQPDEA